MGDTSMPTPDVCEVHRTRSDRYAAYRVYQYDVLIAIVNRHFDLVLVPPQKHHARLFTVSSVGQGNDPIDVPKFVRPRVNARIAERRETMKPEEFRRLRRAETYAERRHLLEDLAFLHGVFCIDRAATGCVEYPSINTICGPGLFLGRGDIMRRGYFIHHLLGLLCGEQSVFCVPRGNVFLHEMLTAPDCNLVLQHARDAIAAVRRTTEPAPYNSWSSVGGAPCVPPGHGASCGWMFMTFP